MNREKKTARHKQIIFDNRTLFKVIIFCVFILIIDILIVLLFIIIIENVPVVGNYSINYLKIIFEVSLMN